MAKFDKAIPPGQEGKIEIAVTGSRVSGQFRKTATVTCNDPDKPKFTLTITGNKVPYVNLSPPGTVVLHGGYGEPISKSFRVTSNEGDDNFKVTGVTSDVDDKITYTVEPTENHGEYEVTVYKNPYLPTMSTYGALALHTNSKHAPATNVQVHIMTRGNILVSPSTLNFGPVRFGDAVTKGDPVTKSVIVSKSASEFSITNVSSDNVNFDASVEPVMPGRQYRVLVTFHPPAKNREGEKESAEMIIHTNDPLEPAIRVLAVARAM